MLDFRYRFVRFGTRFTRGAGNRVADDMSSEATLHENEIAVDVGGCVWNGDPAEPVIIDHHLPNTYHFPSSSCAVLRCAEAIQERFRGTSPVVWLVTHTQPDFDAYAAMYLCRWLIEDDSANKDWTRVQHAVEAVRTEEMLSDQTIDWYRPNIVRFNPAVQWAFLLAAYTAHVDQARRIACPRARGLHSIFYAAIERGRSFGETGGVEFFREVRMGMRRGSSDGSPTLNPLFDSVLENSAEFAPELALLDRETEKYARDIARARKTIVFVPTCSGDFDQEYAEVVRHPLLMPDGALSEIHRSFGDGRRMPTDAAYIRDPESILFKEWARLDVDRSSLRQGFTFTLIAYSNGRPTGANASDYFIALDMENARGRHLYTVWARLQAEEVRLRLAAGDDSARLTESRPGYEARAHIHAHVFGDPWFDGGNYRCTIVATPGLGTAIRHVDDNPDLSTDQVAEIVRRELEYSVYTSNAEVLDAPVSSGAKGQNYADQLFIFDKAPPSQTCRFGKVMLSEDVNLLSDTFVEQAVELLWSKLNYRRTARFDQLDADAIMRTDALVAVQSAAGIFVAHKPSAANDVSKLQAEFDRVTMLACELAEISEFVSNDRLLAIVDRGHELLRCSSVLRSDLARSDARIVGMFAQSIRLFESLESAGELNRARAGALQATQMTGLTVSAVGMQRKVEWLELLFVGVYATELAEVISRYAISSRLRLLTTIGTSALITICAACFLRPWVEPNESDEPSRSRPRSFWWLLLIVPLAVILILGLVLGWLVSSGQWRDYSTDSSGVAVSWIPAVFL